MMDDQRPRAVFSTEDFRLMHNALKHYVTTCADQEMGKYGSLLHRLGRVAPERARG